MNAKSKIAPKSDDPLPGARYITLRLDILSGLFKEMGEISHQRRFGLSVREVRLILQIMHNPGLTLSRLVALTYIEKTLVSKAVTRLTQLGLVQRRIGDQDARHVQLQLTEKGERVARQASSDVTSATAQMMSEFPESDRQAFERVLDALTMRVEQRLAQAKADPGQLTMSIAAPESTPAPKTSKFRKPPKP